MESQRFNAKELIDECRELIEYFKSIPPDLPTPPENIEKLCARSKRKNIIEEDPDIQTHRRDIKDCHICGCKQGFPNCKINGVICKICAKRFDHH